MIFQLYPTPKAVFNGIISPVEYFTVKYGAHNDIAVVSIHEIVASVGVIDLF